VEVGAYILIGQRSVQGRTLELIENIYDKVDYQVKNNNLMSDVIRNVVARLVRSGMACFETVYSTRVI
jgi:hypothetical protein